MGVLVGIVAVEAIKKIGVTKSKTIKQKLNNIAQNSLANKYQKIRTENISKVRKRNNFNQKIRQIYQN